MVVLSAFLVAFSSAVLVAFSITISLIAVVLVGW